MVQNETNLVVADNSGAKSVRIFRLFGGGNRKSSSIGDIVMCAVKTATPNGKVKKGEIVRGVIVPRNIPSTAPTVQPSTLMTTRSFSSTKTAPPSARASLVLSPANYAIKAKDS